MEMLVPKFKHPKKIITLILLSLISLQTHAYDLSKKFGMGVGFGYPVPVWGNPFNNVADPEWSGSIYGRYHMDQSLGMELSISKQGFKETPLDFENINLLAFYRLAGAANLTPVMGLGLGATRIDDYSPSNVKLSLLARAGLEYAFLPAMTISGLVDYQYVSKIMGDMPTDPAHVINPQIALTWYYGGDDKSTTPATEPEKTTDVVSTQKSATTRSTVNKPDINIEFDFEKSEVKSQYLPKLKQLAQEMKSSNNLTGYIEGHADSTGPEEFNDTLSLSRAHAVRNILIGYGADEARLVAEGFGENRPVASNATASGRQKNRRSAVYITVRTRISGI